MNEALKSPALWLLIRNAAQTRDASKYTEAIQELLRTEGLDVANQFNHLALEAEYIPLPSFQAAASMLAQEILNR